jgi:ATP-binding cassette subfamily C protein
VTDLRASDVVTSSLVEEILRGMAALASSGELVASDAAARTRLDHPDWAWLVEEGRLDVFAVELGGGQLIGPLRFLWSAEAPAVLIGVAPAAVARPCALVAVGGGGTRVRRVPLRAIDALREQPETSACGRALVEAFAAQAAAAVRPPGGDRWASGGQSADARALAIADLPAFRESLARTICRYVAEVDASEQARLARKADLERQMQVRGLEALASVLEAPGEAGPLPTADPLFSACQAVGARARIEFRPPPQWARARNALDPLGAVCRASRVRSRKVGLRGNWWRRDHGPLLAFVDAGHRPIALLPRGVHGYELVDPTAESRVGVDAAVAGTLEPFAFEFYRPSPDTPIGLAALARLMLEETRGDLARILLAALAGGVLGLAIPVATGRIFSDLIPGAIPGRILPLLAALGGIVAGTALFDLMKAFALVRFEGRLHSSLQASIVDRLLALPVPFFRRFAIGELGTRAFAVNSARDMLSGATITAILSGVFSVFNLVLLFYYSPLLALVAIGALVVSVAFTASLAALAIRVERRRQDVAGRISGLVFQLVGGIAKLRVAGAERRSFSVWAQLFHDQRAFALDAGLYLAAVAVFNDILPILAGLALFGTAGAMAAGRAMNTGQFIAFYAAFGTFFANGIALSNTFVSLLNIVPVMESARPILETPIEVAAARPDPGELAGHIEVSHVSFRYTPGGPLILDDVNFEARPGEFIAIVGPSGSGKSTLLRLLLGFEPPETGMIYYDGQDLAGVDVSAVRAQMGVVLQTSRLLQGDIFNNIVGATPLTLSDAWDAAERAGLAEDIREMPMQMHTMIAEGGSTLSGGQRQRLLVARAIVRRPRILLFDEATSALDNRTQDLVSRGLEAMQATRIVIAHRLSTIRNADRLYVMEHGRIVQQGTYAQLASVPGLFAQLIARQVA